MRVLIVDDSVVFRMSIEEGLKGISGLRIAGKVSNGQLAVDHIKKYDDVDLMILDMEMPVLDGISTIKAIRCFNKKIIIIVFSSLTLHGAELTLKALDFGANDFVTKQESSSAVNLEESLKMIQETLLPKIKAFEYVLARGGVFKNENKSFERKPFGVSPLESSSLKNEAKRDDRAVNTVSECLSEISLPPKLILIASSTGGPEALSILFKGITKKVNIPILLVQHMPPIFTQKLAEMLNKFTDCVEIQEARNGDVLKGGYCYIAPGDYHMTLGRDLVLRMGQNEKVSFVRPSATVLFESVAGNYPGKTLSFVLTGMGDDGAKGLKDLVDRNDYLYIQDELSSVVWGMPGAVKEKYPHTKEIALRDIPVLINEVLKG